MKIHKIQNVEYWYDPHTKCWWAMKVDQDGHQIGAAEHSYDRAGILDEARYLNATEDTQ